MVWGSPQSDWREKIEQLNYEIVLGEEGRAKLMRKG